VWSFLQQFVLQALIASNLEKLGWARAAVVPVAALLFGVAHLPDWPLAALCAVAGVAWTAIYLRSRHLPLLALTHAWLGALAFYWVLQRDPWGEMFRR
jgi:membrane protease YdiL (CAAX protease family)